MWQHPQLAVCPVHGAVQLARGPHDGEVLAALNDLLGEPLPLPSPE